MKTKITLLLAILALSCDVFATAPPPPPPTIVVRRAIVIGGGTNTATFNNPTQSTVVVGQSGCSSIAGFQAAMQFEFQVANAPVDVTNFKMTVGKFILKKNGATVPIWNTPFGAYHPIGEGTPDYLVYKADETNVVPDGANQWVSGINGDNSGTLIPILSKFQIVNHPVPTSLSVVGEYYELWYEISFTYTYGSQNYNKTLLATDTSVNLLVTGDVPGFVNESNTPSVIDLLISYDLVNWIPAPIAVPFPRPTVVQSIIDLVPSTTNVSPWSNERRFYRYRQATLPGYP